MSAEPARDSHVAALKTETRWRKSGCEDSRVFSAVSALPTFNGFQWKKNQSESQIPLPFWILLCFLRELLDQDSSAAVGVCERRDGWRLGTVYKSRY